MAGVTVRFLTTVTIECEQGQTVPLPDSMAERLILLGLAEPVRSNEPVETPERNEQYETRTCG